MHSLVHAKLSCFEVLEHADAPQTASLVQFDTFQTQILPFSDQHSECWKSSNVYVLLHSLN